MPLFHPGLSIFLKNPTGLSSDWEHLVHGLGSPTRPLPSTVTMALPRLLMTFQGHIEYRQSCSTRNHSPTVGAIFSRFLTIVLRADRPRFTGCRLLTDTERQSTAVEGTNTAGLHIGE